MEEELKKQLETKKSLIKTLQENINTLKDSLSLKDEHVKTLETSLKIKEEKIRVIEETNKEIEKIQEELKKLLSENAMLQKKVDILNEELAKADKDLEQLEMENETLRKSAPSRSKIIDYTNAKLSKDDILTKMREILQEGKHNVMITVPSLEDLQELYLYEVRSSVSLKISCSIDTGKGDQSNLLEEFQSLDNISLRNYSGEDRFSINRDGAELLFAVIGSKDNNFLVVHTKDSNHIKLFNSFTMEAWLRGRKLD
ncbi:MAG: hypothetical protein ACFFAT_14375 [Promethearchaeota archaeon]